METNPSRIVGYNINKKIMYTSTLNQQTPNGGHRICTSAPSEAPQGLRLRMNGKSMFNQLIMNQS